MAQVRWLSSGGAGATAAQRPRGPSAPARRDSSRARPRCRSHGQRQAPPCTHSDSREGHAVAGVSRRQLAAGACAAPLAAAWLGPSPASAGLLAEWLGLGPDALSTAPATASASSEVAQRLLAEMRGQAAPSSWGQPWSRAVGQEAVTAAAARAVPYPPWLLGEWQAVSSFKDVKFPQGQKLVNDRTPGYRMASILFLPNVGSTPRFHLTIDNEVGSISGSNARNILEAFWGDAEVVSSDITDGRLTLQYRGPTVRAKGVEQTVRLTPIDKEWAVVDDTHFICAEVMIQDNIDQNLRGLYKVITIYERVGGSGDAVRAVQRVAAFVAGDSEPTYFDAGGDAVATYDYGFALTRL